MRRLRSNAPVEFITAVLITYVTQTTHVGRPDLYARIIVNMRQIPVHLNEALTRERPKCVEILWAVLIVTVCNKDVVK